MLSLSIITAGSVPYNLFFLIDGFMVPVQAHTKYNESMYNIEYKNDYVLLFRACFVNGTNSFSTRSRVFCTDVLKNASIFTSNDFHLLPLKKDLPSSQHHRFNGICDRFQICHWNLSKTIHVVLGPTTVILQAQKCCVCVTAAHSHLIMENIYVPFTGLQGILKIQLESFNYLSPTASKNEISRLLHCLISQAKSPVSHGQRNRENESLCKLAGERRKCTFVLCSTHKAETQYIFIYSPIWESSPDMKIWRTISCQRVSGDRGSIRKYSSRLKLCGWQERDEWRHYKLFCSPQCQPDAVTQRY